jgi:hypothetical protein
MFEAGALSLVAATGDDAPGADADAKFLTFSQPAINDPGFAAFLGAMKIGSGNVTKADDTGIWSELGALRLIAREGGAAPDATGTTGATGNFASFGDPVFASGDHIAFLAKLKPGTGGVKGSDAAGIWSNSGGTLALVARQGSPAPDAGGATFASFLSLGLPDTGGVVFLAKVKGRGETGKSGTGIWAANPAGVVSLVVRTGDSLTVNGGSKTIRLLHFLPSVLGVPGQTRSFNEAGDLTFRAVFTDRTEAILKVVRAL